MEGLKKFSKFFWNPFIVNCKNMIGNELNNLVLAVEPALLPITEN